MADEPKESMTPDEIEALRAEVRQIIEAEGITARQVADETGIPYGTLTPWLGGTYRGDNAGKAVLVRRWLDTRREGDRRRAVLPTEPEFVLTPSAAAFLDVFAYAQAAPDFAVVVGGAGIGKTTTIAAYRKRASNVFVMEAEPCDASANNMVTALATVVGVTEKRSVHMSRAISAKLANAAALLIIDDAQHLSSQALDQLRTIHDKARVGVVLVGNENIFGNLEGPERTARYAQLYSRVGMRMTQPKPRAKDIAMLIEAWQVTDERAANLLKVFAAKPGALRIMTKVVRFASMLAAGNGESSVTDQHIRAAWTQLTKKTPGSEAA